MKSSMPYRPNKRDDVGYYYGRNLVTEDISEGIDENSERVDFRILVSLPTGEDVQDPYGDKNKYLFSMREGVDRSRQIPAGQTMKVIFPDIWDACTAENTPTMSNETPKRGEQ